MSADALAAEAPAFRVVTGTPNDEELAALAVVISALRRPRTLRDAPANPNIAGGWKSYWHTMRQAGFTGPDAWRVTLRR